MMNYSAIEIRVLGRKILLKMPKNDGDIHFVKGITYARWNQNQFVWEVPHYPGNLEKLVTYFGDRISLIERDEAIGTTHAAKPKLTKNEVLMIQTQNKRLKLLFGFIPELIKHIKTIPYASWDTKNKWWTIPFSEQFLGEINQVSAKLNLKITFEIEPPKKQGVDKLNPNDTPFYKSCPSSYTNKLTELRYSENTVKSYVPLFEEFINHFPTEDLDSLNDKQVVEFSRFLVTDRKVSASYQNQAINAIKFYYEKVLGGNRKLHFVERPRQEQALPTVCSVEETADPIQHQKYQAQSHFEHHLLGWFADQ